MCSPTLSALENAGLERGLFVPKKICQFPDTTCPQLEIEVYDFDEIVEAVYRHAGRGGEIPKSFDCLKFAIEHGLVHFIEMKRFREMKEKYLSRQPRDSHLLLVDKQVDDYSVKIPGKVEGTNEAFTLLQEHLGVMLEENYQKRFTVLTDATWDEDFVDFTLYTLMYLADESTPLDYVQMKMQGMLDESFTGEERPDLVSCATLERYLGS